MSDTQPPPLPHVRLLAPPPALPRRMNHDHESAELEFELPEAVRPSSTRVVAVLSGAMVVVTAAFLVGFLPRYEHRRDLVAEAKERANVNMKVQLLAPKARGSDRALTLPGSVHPLEEATIYPRANGYIRSWNVDMGDSVKEGQLLALIDTPELDQQYSQARAQLAQAEAALAQAKANKGYSQTNLQRIGALAPKGVSSQQELDKAHAQALVDDSLVEVAKANIAAERANLGRVQQLLRFSRVTAPFDGTINTRSIERGTLVSGSAPLFTLSQTRIVRVFVQVPQDVAPSVKTDARAQVHVREYSGRTFDGKVARTAAALDNASRTMQTEIRVPNDKHELLAGMYAEVSITLPSSHRVWELPATAVMTDANGARVAVVENGRVRMAQVSIERDNGATIDIASGVKDTDRVVKLATTELVDGQPVDVTGAAPSAASASTAATDATLVIAGEGTAPASAVEEGMGRITTTGTTPGRRIFVDDKILGETPDTVLVKCGRHKVRIGSTGAGKEFTIPCGGEVPVVNVEGRSKSTN